MNKYITICLAILIMLILFCFPLSAQQIKPFQLEQYPNSIISSEGSGVYGHQNKEDFIQATSIGGCRVIVNQSGAGTAFNLFAPVRWNGGVVVHANTQNISNIPQGVVVKKDGDELTIGLCGEFMVGSHSLVVGQDYFATDVDNTISTTPDADIVAPVGYARSNTEFIVDLNISGVNNAASPPDNFVNSGTYDNSEVVLADVNGNNVNINIQVPDPTNGGVDADLEDVISNLSPYIVSFSENADGSLTFQFGDGSPDLNVQDDGSEVVTSIAYTIDGTTYNAGSSIEDILTALNAMSHPAANIAYTDAAFSWNAATQSGNIPQVTKMIENADGTVTFQFGDGSPDIIVEDDGSEVVTSIPYMIDGTTYNAGSSIEDILTALNGSIFSGLFTDLDLTGTTGFGDFTDNVDDADADASNEIQNLAQVLAVGNDANNLTIENLAYPVNELDAANRGFVEADEDCPLTSVRGGLVTLIGLGKRCITINNKQTLTSDLTIPESTVLHFVGDGMITINTGVTLTINGTIHSSPKHIFENNGTITGSPQVDEYYSEWFGAKTNDGFEDDTAIQQLFDMLKNVGGGTVMFQYGNYYITTPCHVWDNVRLTGVGRRAAMFSLPTTVSATNPEPAPETGAVRRMPVFFLGDYNTAVDNVTIDNLTFQCNDHLIGFSNQPTNWVSTFAALGQLQKDAPNSEVFENITFTNNTVFNSIVTIQIGLQGLGSREPETYGYNVVNFTFTYNYIDGTSNKAVEVNSTDGALIHGNYGIMCQSGYQAIHFCRNIIMTDNYVEFEAEGLLMSNETVNSIMSGNIAVWTGEGLKGPPYDSGGSESVGIMLKNDYTSNATWGTWSRPHVTENITIDNNKIYMDGAATGSVAFSFRTKTNSVLNTWRNITISNNVFDGDIRFTPFLDNNNSVIDNILFYDNDIDAFGSIDFSEVTNVSVQGGVLRNAFTVSGTNGWKFMGVNLENTLTFAAGSSGHEECACIGTVVDNGTNTVDCGASSGGNDNLGNHTLTQNLELSGFGIRNNGASGIAVDNDGDVILGGNGSTPDTEELNLSGTIQVRANSNADNTWLLGMNTTNDLVATISEGSTNGSGGLLFEGARLSGNAPGLSFQSFSSGGARGMDFQAIGGSALGSQSGTYPEYTSTGNMFNFIKRTGTASTSSVFSIDPDGDAIFGLVPINTQPASSALVEIQSTEKGFLPPRMTTVQRDAIAATAGLMIYNTTDGVMQHYDGSAWTDEAGGGGSVTLTNNDAPFSWNAGTQTGNIPQPIQIIENADGTTTFQFGDGTPDLTIQDDGSEVVTSIPYTIDNIVYAAGTDIETIISALVHCEVRVSSESEFTNAVSTANHIVIDAPFTLNSNTTFGGHLEFICDGRITLSNGVTLTLNGYVEAPLREVFDRSDTGTGTLNGSPSNNIWHPEWFGAIPNDNSDDGIESNWLGSVVNNFGGGTIRYGNGVYNMYRQTSIYSNTHVEGSGSTVFQQPVVASQLDYTLSHPLGFTRAAVFFIGDYNSNVDNVSFRDFKVQGGGSQLGLNTNNSHFMCAIVGEFPFGAQSLQMSNITIENIFVNNCDFAVLCATRSNGNDPPESTGEVYAVRDIVIQNNKVTDSAVGFLVREAYNVLIQGNTIEDCQSGIEVMDFCRYVNINDNTMHFEGEGIEISNDTRFATVSNNKIYADGDSYRNTFDSGDGVPVGIMLKNNYTSSTNWGGGPERPPVTDNVVFHNNVVDMFNNLNGRAFETRTRNTAPTSVPNTWSNIHFYNNKFEGGRFQMFPPSGNNLANNLTGWVFSDNHFDTFLCDLSSVTNNDLITDIEWEGGKVVGAFTLGRNTTYPSGWDGWIMKGISFKGGLTLDSGTTGFKVIGNVGVITDNGTGNTVSFNIN